MKICLYGGSFDPVHVGHQQIVEKIADSCDKIIIIPTNQSPHKKQMPTARSVDRCEMLKLLFKNNKKIEINNI